MFFNVRFMLLMCAALYHSGQLLGLNDLRRISNSDFSDPDCKLDTIFGVILPSALQSYPVTV